MIPACREIRKNILEASFKSGHGHIPTSFSIVEAIYAVYASMNQDPKNPEWEERDIFILSKGHASLGYYCVLAQFGYFDVKEVSSLGGYMSNFGCHPDRFKVPGVEASTGSLGHGIGLAVGMALALKIKRSSRRVYVLIGDGESNEGSVWEAIMVANNLGLHNLTIVFDNNRSQLRSLQIFNPSDRLKAFGCDVVELDGHEVEALKKEIVKESKMVRAIVANTRKGYGCRTFADNQYEWHRKSPNESQLKVLLEELDEKAV